MKLVTHNGVIKYASECAPTGHYIVPIYDKGSFLMEIEGPPGWNFGMILIYFTRYEWCNKL